MKTNPLNGDMAIYVRWALLIFTIGVTWANLKADVKAISREQQRQSAAQARVNERFQTFIDGSTTRNENLAGWYERLYQNEKAVAELRSDLEDYANRPIRSPSRSTYRQPTIVRSRPVYPSVPDWQRDPRRNPDR